MLPDCCDIWHDKLIMHCGTVKVAKLLKLTSTVVETEIADSTAYCAKFEF